MLGYWTTFAATGNPNRETEGGAPAWPAYASASDQYLEISEPAPTTIANLRSTQCDFWASYKP
jgi:carboxylesterase type B